METGTSITDKNSRITITTMVFVFKTDVTNDSDATTILQQLQAIFPSAVINFDLEDCDNILRIEDQQLSLPQIRTITESLGVACEELQEN